MNFFRKKPVIIQAVLFIGEKSYEEMCFTWGIKFIENCKFHKKSKCLIIKTLEGKLIGERGNYIIRGVEGEFYPCKREIFEKTYELI